MSGQASDKIGIIVSIGCLVHCLLLPIILPILPFFGFAIDHDSNFHLFLSGLILIIAFAAMIPEFLRTYMVRPQK